jgi:hypothetical protein
MDLLYSTVCRMWNMSQTIGLWPIFDGNQNKNMAKLGNMNWHQLRRPSTWTNTFWIVSFQE